MQSRSEQWVTKTETRSNVCNFVSFVFSIEIPQHSDWCVGCTSRCQVQGICAAVLSARGITVTIIMSFCNLDRASIFNFCLLYEHHIFLHMQCLDNGHCWLADKKCI